MDLDDLPDPLCPEGGALLEISACAVCGTDVKMRWWAVDKAADIIDCGKPIKKLKAWVAEQNLDAGRPLEKLEEMLAQACSCFSF